MRILKSVKMSQQPIKEPFSTPKTSIFSTIALIYLFSMSYRNDDICKFLILWDTFWLDDR